uniref:Glycosyltransferases probably involved in cell wall biogenesis-like protein n=1 Tax=Chlorobium chlorochromatii (strain CaD3) TaxID=340177 RepID=Q3ATR2_CHLCH
MQNKKASWILFVEVGLLIVLLFTYLAIRIYYTINAPFSTIEFILGFFFLCSEVFILYHSFFFFIDILREALYDAEPKRKEPGKDASVAILVPARHEPREVVENTLLTCINIAYENKTVYLLDDSSIEKFKQEAREVSKKLGAKIFTRVGNRGAKAGIVNDILKTLKEKYVVIFDADQNPMPNFLRTLVPLMEGDDKLAFIQTPQFYSNGDASPVAMTSHNQQAIFYEYICLGKSLNHAMFCCGTNVIFRREALQDVGYFDEDTVTEDIATSLRLHAKGWKSMFLYKAYTFGMAPEDLASYFKQQNRWALGTSQLLRKFIHLFFTNIKALKPVQWIEYSISTTYYFIGWAYFFLMAGPVMYIFFNIKSYNIDPLSYVFTFIPFLVLSNIVFFQGMARKSYTRLNMLKVQMLTALSMPVYLSATVIGVLNLDKKGFQVTPKGGATNVPLKALWPQLLLFSIVIVTLLWGTIRIVFFEFDYMLVINVIWTTLQAFMLSGLFYFNKK